MPAMDPAHSEKTADSGTGATPVRAPGQDFIRAIIAEDLRTGKHGGRVVTRFPPEPNGFLHIGHAKSICLNFGIAQEVAGARCHLRFDDTNPETEDVRYVEAIQEDVRWLGFDWAEHLYFASDYFEEMYAFAEHLVREGKAYVDSQDEESIRENRGTISQPGMASPFRERPVEENLDLLRRMRAGEFPNGAHVLRGKIDMASANMLLRDPVLMRIRHADHYRTGDEWCLYPLYDYAHPIEDAIECVTHSLCTLEFESNRALYDWVVEAWQGFARPDGGPTCRPRQYEFARGNLDYTVMSKRKLLELVKLGHVSGWDDPRMPTLAGLRRRGVTPEAIRAFWEMIGITRTESRVDIGKLEYAIRDDLNTKARRVLCVLRPLRVVITNYPEGRSEELDAPYWPHDVPREESRVLPFSRVLYIERDDFTEQPPKGYHRLAPGREVRLRYGYFIRCEEVVKDEAGEVVELRCTYDPETRGGTAPDGRKVKGTIHWVSAEHAVACEVRLYDRLFRVPDPDAAAADSGEEFMAFLNPESLVVLEGAHIEPSVRGDPPGTRYQFERQGYFVSDPVDSSDGALVFNRTVTLRDTWARKAQQPAQPAAGEARPRKGAAAAGGGKPSGKAGRRERGKVRGGADLQEGPGRGVARSQGAGANQGAARAPEPPRTPELESRRRRYLDELELAPEVADILTRELALAELFEAAGAAGATARGAANWIVNELPREIGDRTLENLPFGGHDLGALVSLVEDGTLSSSAGREVLAEMVENGGDPGDIVERLGLRQVSDADALAPIVDEVVAAHAAKAAEYRDGKTGLIGFFVGQVMRKTGGKANPELTRELLERRLADA